MGYRTYHRDVLTYFQGSLRLADPGMCAEALVLPQDETTAAVLIAAILARNYAIYRPFEYSARIEHDDGSPIVIAENDQRVVEARRMLLGMGRTRGYNASEMAEVRAALGAPDQHHDQGRCEMIWLRR